MSEKIYIDGVFFNKEDARVSVLDHGLLYGDGIFEGIRIYGGRVFKLTEHIKRLYESARSVLLDIPISEEAMALAVEETVRQNRKIDGYIRLMVTRGVGPMGLDSAACKKPSVIIIVTDIQLYPRDLYEKGIAVVTAATRRVSHDALEPRVKSLNYLNNVMAKAEAARAGCLEAVMLNAQGYVAECTADNIFIVKGGKLLTPPPYNGALDGITMRTVMELAQAEGIPCEFTPMTRYDLYTADECFMTGTGAEIMPVTEVDGRKIGTGEAGETTKRIIESFKDRVSQIP